jgi:hypothetical protein
VKGCEQKSRSAGWPQISNVRRMPATIRSMSLPAL